MDGRPDLERAAAELAARVPEPLAPLARLAYNYRWSWHPDGPAIFEAVNPTRWRQCGMNPVRLLQEASAESLRRAADDGELLERARRLDADIRADFERPWSSDVEWERPVAFLCAEYAIHVSLPVYSGGLGALAGDFVKEASDRALPFVAIGLMYRQGYFRQRIDGSGWQHEYWIDTDPDRVPAALVTTESGEPLTVGVPLGEREVRVQVWRVEVGRVPLFLLDTDRPENDRVSRWISSRLYVGDPRTRLAQYVVLGVGGVRVLNALNIRPGTLHLNEGHAALAPLEAARAEVLAGKPLAEALEATRAKTVFTTHTPVPAGNDTYPNDQVETAIHALAGELHTSPAELIRLGHTHTAEEHEPFGVTQFALRLSQTAGGVSRRHGEVAREMWHELWPDKDVNDVPIRHVTNGVHIPTWIGARMRELLDRHLGEGWIDRAADPATWDPIDDIPDNELWEARCAQRAELVDFARDRSVGDRLARDDVPEYVDAALETFQPEALTVGFARRAATYKRVDLLVKDPARTLALLAGERPVQVILAGKAHPRDEEAKKVMQSLFQLKGATVVGHHVIFLDDYDLATAARLVQGCDVWLNLPRPPLEASGTSGMKSVMNGGLQLSVLDGWWSEGYDGSNGWALAGDVDHDHAAQDARDAAELYRVFEEEVVPEFYERSPSGLPSAWLDRMRNSLRTLGPAFSATRMLAEYVEGSYSARAPAV